MSDPLILIVDDNADASRAACALLRGAGFEAVPISNAKDALLLLENGLQPAVIATDIMLPGLDGNAFAMRVWEMGMPTKVVIVTGYEAEMVRPEVKSRADAVVQKPIEDTRLLDAIRKVLGKGP